MPKRKQIDNATILEPVRRLMWYQFAGGVNLYGYNVTLREFDLEYVFYA